MTHDASLLLKPEYATLLQRCFERPHSVAELARATGQKANTVYVRVRRLVAAGVLAVEREERRAGKRVRFYRPTHPMYEVPFADTAFETYPAFLEAHFTRILGANLRRAYARSGLPDTAFSYLSFFQAGYLQSGVRVEGRDPAGTRQWLRDQHLVHRFVPLRLTAAELDDLRDELEALTARYARPFDPDEDQTAVLGLFLLPN